MGEPLEAAGLAGALQGHGKIWPWAMTHQLLVVPAVGGLVEHSRSQVGRAVGQPLAALTTIFLGQAAARCGEPRVQTCWAT